MSHRYIVTDNGHKVRNIPVPNGAGAWGAVFVTPEGKLDVTIATDGTVWIDTTRTTATVYTLPFDHAEGNAQ